MALMMTMSRMAIESPKRARNDVASGSGAKIDRPAAMAAAPISASTVKSETWLSSRRSSVGPGFSVSLLGPRRRRRRSASSWVKPPSIDVDQ
jgi:hypothetical protein